MDSMVASLIIDKLRRKPLETTTSSSWLEALEALVSEDNNYKAGIREIIGKIKENSNQSVI